MTAGQLGAVQMGAERDRFRWSRRALAREADFLDGVVDTQLEFIRQQPEHRRAGAPGLVEALAALVMLAQDHRYCAQGWISRRELRARTRRALAGLDALLQLPAVAPRAD
jgi:hypothetical protein